MPGTYTYPGVYVEEVPSGVRTIAGVSTSDTAFVDFFSRGPLGVAVRVTSMEDFERRFGGLHRDSESSYAIAQYYLNGGSVAWVVRVGGDMSPVAAGLVIQGGSPLQESIRVRAKTPGTWGRNLQVAIDHAGLDPLLDFNLVVREVDSVGGRNVVLGSEVHRNLRTSTTHPRHVAAVIGSESDLIVVDHLGIGDRPAATAADASSPLVLGDPDSDAFTALGDFDDEDGNVVVASDGGLPTATTIVDGLAALDRIAPEVFNILCLPAAGALGQADHATVVTAGTVFCESHRAFLVVDPPSDVDTLDDLNGWTPTLDAVRHRNAAVYFPRVNVPDPLNENRPREIGASGAVAGIFARTDATRGVWKAPAGTDARVRGATLGAKLTDLENGSPNKLGINILRSFPIFGNVVWGARTLDGADQQASEWKYVPVRRTALFIEESLYQALKWVVFEPNDEPLWSQIRLNVGTFMNDLFRQGAFQGSTPADAYFVKCDGDTTTQSDINRGIVNILVGFAPLKPAEFVVIKVQQIAGQLEA